MSSLHAPSASRRRTVLILLSTYAAALGLGLVLFLAQRIYSRHATFSQREFFWVGDIHENAPMGLRMGAKRVGFAVLNHGLHDPTRRIPVRTDRLGCRVPIGSESTESTPGGLVAVGCSCTFGHGVAAESTYVTLAADLLGVDAHNLGVCGYSSVTSLLHLQETIGALQPRWVVYGFGNFHLERSARPRVEPDVFQAYARVQDGVCRILPPVFDNRRVFAAASDVESLYYLPRLAGGKTPFDIARLRALLPLAFQDLERAMQPRSIRLRFERPALPDTAFCRFLLESMLETCRSHDAEFVLLFFPAFYGETPNPGLLAAARDLEATSGFHFVDCRDALFAGVRNQEEYAARWQVPRDGHPNRFMHLEMGRALALELGRDPELPPFERLLRAEPAGE